jgi:Holliday junction resolvasome RuvABC DNA-binding subunit
MDAAAPVREGARRNAGRAASNPRRDSIDFDEACLRTMAKMALTTMGWKPTVARAAVAAAIEAHGEDITLEQLVRESLRRCRGAKA